jgi:sterol desaturase/sphingolipid hydroxylase (fatty acid hydroxylase superfamily)
MSMQFVSPSHRGAALAMILLLILGEALWLRLHGRPGYDWRETAASTAVMAGQVLGRLLSALVVPPVLLWVYRHRLFSIALDGWAPLLGLFLGSELLYYGFHRASHGVRWLWASHGVHHSPTRLNFSAAYRLGWTNALSGGWLFFAPLVWLGYAPAAVLGAFAANLAFQFLLHTEAVGRLGPLEWVFNTPSHHRVHHASNPQLLDRNFGGVLIVFDRLFGTHAEEPRNETLHYGLAGTPPSYNPLRIALGEWGRLLADLRQARGLRQAWLVAFGRP